jgi:hypothetical protein
MVRITDPERSRSFYEALGFTFAGDFDIVRTRSWKRRTTSSRRRVRTPRLRPVSDAADAGEKIDNANGRRRRRGVRAVFGAVAGFRGSGPSGASLLDARGRASRSAGPALNPTRRHAATLRRATAGTRVVV